MKRPLPAFILAVLLIIPSAFAQETDWSTTPPDPAIPQGENLDVPEGWRWRLDRSDPDVQVVADSNVTGHNIQFVNMTPGWHIKTGPAVIFYHPALSAEGSYRVEATIHLFPPGERNEAYGLFIGGSDLADANQSYLYFLVRRSGEYLVKRRNGEGTETVVDWTGHDAVVPYTEDSPLTVANTMAVEAHPDELRFCVNGEQVTALPREDLPSDGQIGLRINHGLNVHVEDLSVEPLP